MKLATLMLIATCAYAQVEATPKAGGHAVTISWTASTTAGVSYNVYRFTGACPGSTFTKITASPITATTYDDASVTGGATYCYYATSYLATANPNESVPSNKAAATVPGDQPNPPTQLTVNPATATVITGNKQQFTASRTPVNWSISPQEGSISASGLYTAPNSIQGNNVVVLITATDSGETANAEVTLRKK